jgi:hypothetical protein
MQPQQAWLHKASPRPVCHTCLSIYARLLYTFLGYCPMHNVFGRASRGIYPCMTMRSKQSDIQKPGNVLRVSRRFPSVASSDLLVGQPKSSVLMTGRINRKHSLMLRLCLLGFQGRSPGLLLEHLREHDRRPKLTGSLVLVNLRVIEMPALDFDGRL